MKGKKKKKHRSNRSEKNGDRALFQRHSILQVSLDEQGSKRTSSNLVVPPRDTFPSCRSKCYAVPEIGHSHRKQPSFFLCLSLLSVVSLSVCCVLRPRRYLQWYQAQSSSMPVRMFTSRYFHHTTCPCLPPSLPLPILGIFYLKAGHRYDARSSKVLEDHAGF